MIVFKSKRFPPPGFVAINLFGIIVSRREYGEMSKYQLNHERIHSFQMLELLGLFFYILYFIEWVLRLIQYRSRIIAYYNISFEREAYSNDRNLDYLTTRKRFAFVRYLIKRDDKK